MTKSILENEYCKVEIDSKGAELKSFINKKNNYEVIWQGDKKYWKRSSPTLFPYIGAIKDNKYFLNNKEFKMTRHGFVRDAEFEKIDSNNEFISFLFKDNEETYKMYPYKFNLYINYYLKGRELEIEYIIENLNEDIMYYNIGGHTAYNFLINEGNKYIEFEKNENKFSGTFDIESGLTLDKKIEVLNNEKELLVKYDLFKYDTLVFKELDSNYLILNDRDSQNRVKITFEDFPYLAIWTPKAPFLCIEPWKGITDYKESNNNIEDKKGIFTLEANEKINLKTLIEIL